MRVLVQYPSGSRWRDPEVFKARYTKANPLRETFTCAETGAKYRGTAKNCPFAICSQPNVSEPEVYEHLEAFETVTINGGKVRRRSSKAQANFKKWVMKRDGMCIITGDTNDLEGAHIQGAASFARTEYEQKKAMRLDNGITLRADIHKAFDLGYWAIDPEGAVVTHGTYRFPTWGATRDWLTINPAQRYFVTQRWAWYIRKNS